MSLHYTMQAQLEDYFEEGLKGGLSSKLALDYTDWKTETEGLGTVDAFKEKLKTEQALKELVTGGP